MDGLQEQICAGCEFYEDNYKKALDRFLLYKEKIMCTQTLIQKYEKRKQHNQQLLMKLQKSRQSVTAVRERFMHYMERYMPLEKSYSELKAAHNDLEDKMLTQSTTLIALQQHNKQLSALVEVQGKGVNEQREKSEKLEEELKRKVRINQIAKGKADDKNRSLMKSAVELAVLLKDKGMLPDSYKLCLKSWKKQLSLDIKPENCGNGGRSPDKASSISSQDTGFDSSKSMSDDENPFDENAMRRKGAAGDKRCTMASKTAAPSIPLETSISDKSVNTSDIVRNFSTSRATQNFQNIRDIGVNTSLSMLTSDLSKCLHDVTVGDCKNSRQSPSEQGMEDHNFEPLPFDTDSQMINPRSHQASIFSPVKGAVHSASAEMPPTSAEKPPTSVEMPPSNDCVEEYQSNDEIPTNNAAVSASLETCSTDLKANVLSSIQCDSFQADFGVSQTSSNNNSVFQQQPVQAGNMKKRNLTLLGKRSSAQKKSISNKTQDPDKEEINQDCKSEIKPLKRVCLDECSSKYSSVLARFSIGNDVSSKHHSPMKAKMTNPKTILPDPKTILPDPKYTNIFTHDFVKSLDHFTSIIRSKTFLKYAKKNNCQRSLKLRKNILKTVRSPRKHFAPNKPSPSYSNVVETASGCFLETVNDTPVSVHGVERTPKSRKFEDRLTLTETVKCHHEVPNAAVKVSKRKSKISSLQCKTGMLGSKKQQKKGRSHLRLMVSEEGEKSRRHLGKNILQHETLALTCVTPKQVEHEESLVSDIVTHYFEPELDNQTVNSLEKDKKDAENVVILNSTYNCKETVSNSKCSSAIPDTLNFSTNNNSTELKRKDSDNVSCLGYTVLLDDLSVSDDNSSPESIKDNSELSQCIQAERSNDECGSDSDVTSNNFAKTDVPQNVINNAAKSELLKMNHNIIGSEKSCDKQCGSEIIEEVSGHSNARYFIPQVVNSNESMVKYEMVETDMPIECSQEICVADQIVDLLDQKCDNESKVQKINLISEAGESISESNTDGRTTNNVEVLCTQLNSGSDSSTSEVATVNEKELELISVSSSKNCTVTLAQPYIAADCTTQSSGSANTEDCTMDYTDWLNDHNTMIFTPGSEVNTDKDVAKQGSFSPSDSPNKEIYSADNTQDMYNVDSELSKDFSEIQKCTNEIVNQSECKDVKDTELLTAKSGLQKGLIKDATSDHQKNCNIDVNGKSEKELQEEIAHPNSLLKEDLFTQKSLINCSESEAPLIKEQQELLTVKSGLQNAISDQQENCNIDVNGKSEKELEEEITHPNSLLKEDLFTRRSLINVSDSEAPLIKEQQESNKDDKPVEKIPETELDISKQEGKDTAEAYCKEYYMPPRTKKRIAHKPKPQDSGSEICSEDKNFKIPIKAVRTRTPRKTKQKTEDELRPSASEICSEDNNFKSPIKSVRKQTTRKKQKIEDELSNIKSVNQEAQNSSSKHLGHAVNEIDNMKKESSLKPKCSSSEVTENVNCVSEAKKLNTENELCTDADSTKKRQLNMPRIDHKQLEPPSTHLQATRRSDRLKKVETLKLWQRLNVYAVKRRNKLKDEKCSTSDSNQEMVSIKTENSDDGPSSPDMDHVKKEKCDINEALLAGEPVPTVENSKVEKLHKLEDDTDDGAVGLLIGGNKRRIKTETGDESNRKKLAPSLFKKPSCYQTEFENEANCTVSSNPLEDAPQVSCKSEIQSLSLVPVLSDKNKCKEECADVNMATLTSQEHNKCGSVTSSESRTSLEETKCNNDTGHSNGEYIHVHNNNESNVTLDGINVSYAKGDIIRKCLAIQQRNKLAARRPTRKKFNEQQVFVYQQLSELLEGDFTNEVLNTALENFGQDDTPVDAIALVRCVLKTLLQEDCNEIDRSHDVRAPPLSVVEEKLITLMITLRNRCTKFSTLINDFLTAVEYYILNLRTTPEYDVLHILTRFHTALCKAEGLRERAQAFCYDALYCLKRKCFPIIYTVLTYYPEVFPRASLGMTSPLCVCIVYSIFTSMNDANNTYLKIKPLITLLCRIYDYKLEEVLSGDLVDCFLKHLKCQTSKSGEVCAAVTLLAKRKDRAWAISQLIPKYIAPIIQEWRHGKINEAVLGGVIDLIGCVVKPFTEQCDLGPILKIFKGILLADKVTQTLKMKAALSLARQASHHFSEVAPILYEWEPEGELPNEFWEQMSDILSVKPHTFWTSFLSTCEENSD